MDGDKHLDKKQSDQQTNPLKTNSSHNNSKLKAVLMNLGPSLSVDQLTETNFPFQNFNFTGNINSHVHMNIFPSVNPMDEEDFRKDGLP